MSNQTILMAVALLVGCTGLAFGQNGTRVLNYGTPAQRALVQKSASLAQAAADALDAGAYSRAEADAHASIAMGFWGGATAEESLARALEAQGKSDEALKVYTHMVIDEKDCSQRTLLPYALLELRKGEWSQALDTYKKAPPPGSPFVGARELLQDDGDYSYDNQQPKELEADIHIAMGFDDIYAFSWVPGHYFPGRNLAEFRKALNLEPDSPLAHLAYAEGLRETGKRSEARTEIQEVANKYTGDVKTAADAELGIYHTPPPAGAPTTK